MTDPTPNLPLLRKTLDWVTEQYEKRLRGEPSEWDQGKWLSLDSEYDEERLYNVAYNAGLGDAVDVQAMSELISSCGTACCIAGKVMLETMGRQDAFLRYAGVDEHGDFVGRTALLNDMPSVVAQRELGLTDSEAVALFAGGNDYAAVMQIANSIAERAGERL